MNENTSLWALPTQNYVLQYLQAAPKFQAMNEGCFASQTGDLGRKFLFLLLSLFYVIIKYTTYGVSRNKRTRQCMNVFILWT